MDTITASIERSLQNCSLNNRTHSSSSSSSDSNNNSNSGQPRPRGGVSRSTTSGFAENNIDFPNNTLELNSEIRLPYYWEQCLDLKTGEIYYINWRTGMKSRDDPRTISYPGPEMMINIGGLICSEEDDDDNSGYDSEGSSTEESSPSSSSRTSRSEQCQYNVSSFRPRRSESSNANYKHPQQQVLVVAGCKGCFMYFMVPKQVKDCPKCFGQLLHFDRSQNVSP